MLKLFCPECPYEVLYADSSFEILKSDAHENKMNGYHCPKCHRFGLKAKKA